MATPPPIVAVNKSLFEHPAGLLGISPRQHTVHIGRNLRWDNVDHLQEATAELLARTSVGWRVRTTPSTNHHCGLYAVYQSFVALSRRFPLLIPGPIPTLDATYDWLIRDRRHYHRFAVEHGDYSDVGDVVAHAYVHNFSGEQLDLLALWLGQQSNSLRAIRVINLFQDKSSPQNAHRHFMIPGRMSVEIDLAPATGELYLFIHYAPDIANSMAHWSMFSDRDWEFQKDEDPNILSALELTIAEDNWELEEQDRSSRTLAKKYPANLPSIEKMAWLCGHLSKNPNTDYESEVKPRTLVTPRQLSGQFGLGLKDSNIRKAIQTWRDRLAAKNPKAFKCLVTSTSLDQTSILRGKSKPRLVEYQRKLIDLGRFVEATNVAALRQFIDSFDSNTAMTNVAAAPQPSGQPTRSSQPTASQSLIPAPASPRATDPPASVTISVGAARQPSTPPRAPITGAGPYYVQRQSTSPISPGKSYPAPKDQRGKRIRTPSEDEEDDNSSDDGTGSRRKRTKTRDTGTTTYPSGNSPKLPKDGDNGSAPAQASGGSTNGANISTASGSGGGAGGTSGLASYVNIDPMLLRSGLQVRTAVTPERDESAVTKTNSEAALSANSREQSHDSTSSESVTAETGMQSTLEETSRDEMTAAVATIERAESTVTDASSEDSLADEPADGAEAPTSTESVPTEPVNMSTVVDTILEGTVAERSRESNRRRSWPQYGRPLTQLLLRRERERSARRSPSPALSRSGSGVSRVERHRAGIARRRRNSRSWLRRIGHTSLEAAIIAGMSLASYNLTDMMLSADWRRIFTAAAERVGNFNVWERFGW